MVSGTPVAGLPMYDWPEVADHVDTLWLTIRRELARRGIAAPARLKRPEHIEKLWRDPAMIVGQVCALNPVRDGLGEVEPLGTIAYAPPAGLPDPEPGVYYSVIVCRRADVPAAGSGLAEFRGARIASNGTDSHSGYWSLGHHVRELAADGPLFGDAIFTGSHRGSVQALSAGTADLAAIDVHSWRLAQAYEPAAADLAVITTTDPTVGVTCATAWEHAARRDTLNDAIGAAVERVIGTPTAAALAITGYRRRTLADFHVVADRVRVAARHPWHSSA